MVQHGTLYIFWRMAPSHTVPMPGLFGSVLATLALQSEPPASAQHDLQEPCVRMAMAGWQSSRALLQCQCMQCEACEEQGALPPSCHQYWGDPPARAQLWRAGCSWPQQGRPAPQTGLHMGHDISTTALGTLQQHLFWGSLFYAAREEKGNEHCLHRQMVCMSVRALVGFNATGQCRVTSLCKIDLARSL